MTRPADGPALSRRAWLQVAAAAVALPSVSARASTPAAEAVVGYLQTRARPGGGYAWDDLVEPHLTPTFAAIGCYRLLGVEPPGRPALAQFVRAHHPTRLKKLEQEHREFNLQQIQSLVWLGEDVSSFAAVVRGWKAPVPYLKQYERHSYPVFRHQVTAFTCRALLGLSRDDLAPAFVDYLNERRRPDGSFNNTPAADGSPGHVLNTWWGLQALETLGRGEEKKAELVEWLRRCQLPGGGFTYRPGADIGGVDDLAYTWAAVRALRLVGSEPRDREGCARYLAALWNSDGGAGDRPGWRSNPVATYRALDAQQALGLPLPERRRAAPPRSRPLPDVLKVFTAQIEAHGQGSPAEAVDLARALKIHLWGAKNAKPGWLARAQGIADREGVPVRFFVANEEYGTWVDVPGLGTYSHTSDIIGPAGGDIGPSLANQPPVSWPEYRARRLDPLQKAGGRLVWQFGENEELVRMFLDDSLERGGFAAISTFHFGNPDFTNSEPFLNRYRGRIPFVALQDAHGPEPWWFADMTTGFRTLFLAHEPTWEGWLEALKNNWVVSVRRDAVSQGKTWIHGGPREVIEFVRQHERDWRWWNNPVVARPLVSLVAVGPGDEFEVARPETGIAIRVRCAWQNTAQGQPRAPMVELVSLAVDGSKVEPALVARRRPAGPALADHYHVYHLADPSPGPHTATAVVRPVDGGSEVSRTMRFRV